LWFQRPIRSIYQQLCHYGLISGDRHGRPECGPASKYNPTPCASGAHVTKGDSGGPVAELIGPWLKCWHLRFDGG
jgi:hypothetical protein